MRINFYYKDTKEPVGIPDEFYVDMYGDVYQFEEDPLDCRKRSDVGWEIL